MNCSIQEIFGTVAGLDAARYSSLRPPPPLPPWLRQRIVINVIRVCGVGHLYGNCIARIIDTEKSDSHLRFRI